MPLPRYKFGKTPAKQLASDVHFANYITSKLKDAPASWNYADAVPKQAWGMLGNDTVGDCTIAGPMHQWMCALALSGNMVDFTSTEAIGVYSAWSGYDPTKTDPQGNNPTDNGMDMVDVAKDLLKPGLLTVQGDQLNINGWARVNPHNPRLLAIAAYEYFGVQLGVQLPSSAPDQTDNGEVWSATDAPIEGGHDVYLVQRLPNGNWLCVTWGQLQELTLDFILKYADEAILYIMDQALIGGKAPVTGIAEAQLISDSKSLSLLAG